MDDKTQALVEIAQGNHAAVLENGFAFTDNQYRSLKGWVIQMHLSPTHGKNNLPIHVSRLDISPSLGHFVSSGGFWPSRTMGEPGVRSVAPSRSSNVCHIPRAASCGS